MPSTSNHILGKLVLSAQGEILKSGGDLQNDEATAAAVARLLMALPSQTAANAPPAVRRFSLHYSDHALSVVLAHGQVHVVKMRREAPGDDFLQED